MSQTTTEDKNRQDLLDMVMKDNKQPQEEDKSTSEKEQSSKSSQDNEVASTGINLNDLANKSSLDSYTKISLLDSPFYSSKEIYKNQKSIDNQNMLRRLNLKNDRLHQQMVNQQYNR